ncbi:GNAT family N-acetyltransferase [Staphylococcus capitis]|uniref:N-acetyltransferase n=2 Tax=Staphylococcus TaxID=1279 RepID=A0A7Z7YVG5_STACP|nr:MULTISPECIES: GNAT family N-acetyltransferase [Staphylococcus]MBC3080594.1 GNAT family N-acetyltransferase [Staphylococcus capitis]MBC8780441.1 GNAT family N-acetyltransferase [Staphylococcus capitis]MBE7320998.1 GNAT family N-acetyltransferase [Staphylococcus capitis]MBU5291471.1 GNAT family N-acetyltransferase [Staphylococcus capitis]MCC3690436.1 GNAT family N-acetyltransferase [Staphylococcus capitis]
MVEINFEAPKVQEYCDLRLNAGMSPKSIEAAEKGLPNACFNVTIYDDNKLIGMGRVIGDGGTAFQIVDIAVNKEYQGLGHGRTIMEEIMKYIDRVAEKGTYISLMADYPADKLYEKFGFISTEPYSKGMYIKY